MLPPTARYTLMILQEFNVSLELKQQQAQKWYRYFKAYNQ